MTSNGVLFCRPQLSLKRPISGTECYIDEQYAENSITTSSSLSTLHSNNSELPVVFEFHGPLLFINVERFKNRFNEVVMAKFTSLQTSKEKASTKSGRHKKVESSSSSVSVISFTSTNGDGGFDDGDNDHKVQNKQIAKKSCENLSKQRFSTMSLHLSPPSSPALPTYHHQNVAIFDMVYVPYIDGKGAATLKELSKQLERKMGVHLLLATVSPLVLDTFQRTNFFDVFDRKKLFFTLADAVAFVCSNFQGENAKIEVTKRKFLFDNVTNVDAAVFMAV